MQRQIVTWVSVLIFSISFVNAQKIEQDSIFRRYFLGSSAFMLGNLFPNPPGFYQLNFGYWLTKKDVVSIEAKTWGYGYPLGIPYGNSFEAPEEAYPGFVRGYGLGAAYQRYLWKGLYAAVHAAAFSQKYLNKEKEKIQTGFQLFTVLRVGYHIKLFKNRFFIEPSLGCTYWPINTNLPASFATLESKWPNYFLFEPGFHFGIKF